MRWLLDLGSRTQGIAGGDAFVDVCPACSTRSPFQEVETTDSVGVFFVDLIESRQRGFRCDACGEVLARAEDVTANAPPAPRALDVDAMAAEQRRRDAERALAVTAVDDELAALKRRLGR